MTEPLPLAGFTVAVTAARKGGELTDALRRKGAHVLHGPAMRTVELAGDTTLREWTREIVARPPDVTIVTTGTGFRGWLAAARQWGTDQGLLAALAGSRLLVRGPKALGAVRAEGLDAQFVAPSELVEELVDHLVASDPGGQRIVVQQHGAPLREVNARLRAAGAEVCEIEVYRWGPPSDPAPLDALIDAVIGGDVDALAFTSAPAVAGMLDRAAGTGRAGPLHAALGHTLLACVGPVTAATLTARDLPVACPERSRTGALVRLLAQRLPHPDQR